MIRPRTAHPRYKRSGNHCPYMHRVRSPEMLAHCSCLQSTENWPANHHSHRPLPDKPFHLNRKHMPRHHSTGPYYRNLRRRRLHTRSGDLFQSLPTHKPRLPVLYSYCCTTNIRHCMAHHSTPRPHNSYRHIHCGHHIHHLGVSCRYKRHRYTTRHWPGHIEHHCYTW